MITICVSDEIKNACSAFAGAAIYAKVKNTPHNEKLWEQIDISINEYKANHQLEDIKKNPVIAATRAVYKKLGKDPNRYRPSAEALCRRIIRELGLYQIDTLVDLINLVSIKTGYSIGGFDADKIEGNVLTLGVGKENEPYEAIGRGMMNIDGLPVYRDNVGGIGTPTSDNERTKIELNTTAFFALFNGYNGKEGLVDAVNYMKSLLVEFAEAEEIQVIYY
ncbi:B3/4 domain-containing protein [Prevotella sp. 10(H)]|uniref:B3/B4 domain-containing protein n=1 Tax=Prevotella sp. 10(H) TaxID=1158294 RepID=UPI0004A77453|nr:phenylalanine--tRNA ligase beta subunit-related protein [Prevotella sp. 10(H)]